ncbi:MAG TPA: penicillin-binding transpeptidase domain-containing protein [bacterium]|nr:penicillin-binding transpeptidase domain-containing protein [bacterium]
MIYDGAQRRIRIVFLLLFCILSALIVRLSYLQYVLRDAFVSKADNQHKMTLVLEPKRGEIYDTKGRVLALSVPTRSLFAVPGDIDSPFKVVEALSGPLGIEKGELFRKITQQKTFVYLKRKVDRELAQEIDKLKLKGVYSHEDTKRFYPKGELLANIIGVVNIDDDGLEGVELFCNRYLKGTRGVRLSEKDAAGREIIPLRFQEVPPIDGNNIHLTIDEVVQHIAEKELDAAYAAFHPKNASAIVMDVRTGDILAIANRPTFDPNNVNAAPPENRRNYAVTDFFEPGSTFKTITGAAALNEGAVRLTDTFFCENGSWKVPGKILHDSHGYGTLTFKEIIEKSSNIGICKVAARLGAAKLSKYIRDFGYGALTGITLPGEVCGILRPVQRWSKMSMTAIPMGQELTVTPIQMVRAYAAIANGGILLKPRFIKSIVTAQGELVKEYKPEPVRRVVSEKATRELIAALKGVVGEGGTAKRASIDGYEVAGKTGTAQKVGPDGRFSHTLYFASFIGFVPADNPRVVIMVCLNEPRPQYYGGVVAAPAFSEIARGVLKYLDVQPTAQPAETKLTKND